MPLPPIVNPHDADDEDDSETALLARSGSCTTLYGAPVTRGIRVSGDDSLRFEWGRYYTDEAELQYMRKPVREYYKRMNHLVSQYRLVDELLDGPQHEAWRSRPLQPASADQPSSPGSKHQASVWSASSYDTFATPPPRRSHTLASLENSALPTPLTDPERGKRLSLGEGEALPSSSVTVQAAIRINFAANVALLAGKVAVTLLTSSMSVLASLVDAILDMFSTLIVMASSRAASRADRHQYPTGRQQLEPLGVLILGVVMVVAFAQVGSECVARLLGPDRAVVRVGWSSAAIMLGTVALKGACWLWCRLVPNSGVQALAQDAFADVIFNAFSLLFPLLGTCLGAWFLDPLGGLVLSVAVALLWARTARAHLRRLSGAAAHPHTRSALLYAAARYAPAVRYVRACRAYHAGDCVRAEVDVVMDRRTPLRHSHDLAEGLALALEAMPGVDRAWVHADYSRLGRDCHLDRKD